MNSIATPELWTGFSVLVIVLLAVDLSLHRKAHEISFREALIWSAGWVVLALAFNGFVYLKFGSEPALEFLAGYVIEKALSIDNIFVFLVLFEAFAVPKRLQHRVLFWGIIGALVMRGLFIAAGAALLSRFHWILYLFGIALVITGTRLLVRRESRISEPREIWLFRAFARVFPVTEEYSGGKFLISSNGGWSATPLLASLVAIEAVDLVFALDSIPAIFAITTDPFIVLTSNVFAIFGLRSMFFLFGGALQRFRYLSTGLALVLMFIGVKLMVSGVYAVPVALSLAVVVGLLAASMAASLWLRPGREGGKQRSGSPE